MTEKTTHLTIKNAEIETEMKSPKRTTLKYLQQFARVYSVLPGLAAAGMIVN